MKTCGLPYDGNEFVQGLFGSLIRILLAAVADNPGRIAYDDRTIGHGFGYNGAGSNDAMATHVSHYDCPIANPGVAANGNSRPLAWLLAHGNVKACNTMLPAAIHDRYVRANEHITC